MVIVKQRFGSHEMTMTYLKCSQNKSVTQYSNLGFNSFNPLTIYFAFNKGEIQSKHALLYHTNKKTTKEPQSQLSMANYSI